MKIFLTVSSTTGRIQISWFNIKPASNSIIVITDRPPNGRFRFINNKWRYCRTNKNHLNYWTIEVKRKNGQITTNFPFNIDMNKISIHTKCYGYWAVLLSKTIHHRQSSGLVTKEAVTCLRAHSTWMNDNRIHFGKFNFRQLFLVGTHNSGAYPSSNPIYLRMVRYIKIKFF